MKCTIATVTCTVLLAACSAALAAPAEAADKAGFADTTAKRSYALGMDIGRSIKGLPVELDVDALTQGLRDTLGGSATRLSEQESKAILRAFMRDIQVARAQEARQQAQANLEAGKAFLARNKTRAGVRVTDSGLQYKILEKGGGPQPDMNDTVTVHYVGKLIDGTVFDSSRKRGQPVTFPVSGVIAGWTEALQMMHEGARYKLFIPPDLAYGARGAGTAIGPNETLIFTVELLEVHKKE